jgi:hypothetical protein
MGQNIRNVIGTTEGGLKKSTLLLGSEKVAPRPKSSGSTPKPPFGASKLRLRPSGLARSVRRPPKVARVWESKTVGLGGGASPAEPIRSEVAAEVFSDLQRCIRQRNLCYAIKFSLKNVAKSTPPRTLPPPHSFLRREPSEEQADTAGGGWPVVFTCRQPEVNPTSGEEKQG